MKSPFLARSLGASLAAFHALAVTLLAISAPLPAQAHEVDCKGRTGIELARCERHQKMAAKCGPIKGEAHYVCDREFLLAHPLDCKVLTGAEDAKRCEAELTAAKRCEPKPGREFLVCLRDASRENPMGG